MRQLREYAEVLAGSDGAKELRVVEKVLIYTFSEDLSRVLSFYQPDYPEAGMQIPAGTVEDGEGAEHAAYREFREETGYEIPGSMILIAESIADMREFKPEIHLRSWFAVRNCRGLVPENDWHHTEESPDRGVLRYTYIWTRVERASGFIAGQGAFASGARRCAEVVKPSTCLGPPPASASATPRTE